MKNLVMGVATQYDWYTLQPFFESWKEHSKTECVIFYDDLSPWTVDCIRNLGVRMIPIDDEWKAGHIVNTRWSIFKNFLEQHKDEYRQVFISDTRDAVFQGEIFDSQDTSTGYLGYSTEKQLIKASINQKWLTDYIGENAGVQFKDKKSICGGTIWGTLPEILELSIRMVDIIGKDRPSWGMDQAALNYIIYSGLPGIVLRESDTETGNVLNVVQTQHVSKEMVSQGVILNGTGKVPAVVHQYDRHKLFVDVVNRRYRNKKVVEGIQYHDLRSNLEILKCCVFYEDWGNAFRLVPSIVQSKPEGNVWNLLADILDHCSSMQKSHVVMEVIERILLDKWEGAMYCIQWNERSMLQSIERIARYLHTSAENRHFISLSFVDSIGRILWNFAQVYAKHEDWKRVVAILEQGKLLPYKKNQDFFIMLAKSCRYINRINGALCNYEKALAMQHHKIFFLQTCFRSRVITDGTDYLFHGHMAACMGQYDVSCLYAEKLPSGICLFALSRDGKRMYFQNLHKNGAIQWSAKPCNAETIENEDGSISIRQGEYWLSASNQFDKKITLSKVNIILEHFFLVEAQEIENFSMQNDSEW